MHNGATFSDSDIEGLCSVGNGNKTKNARKVGYKGIGFKAVFMQSSSVYIQSGEDYCFKFDREECFGILSEKLRDELTGSEGPLYDDVPWQIIPIEAKPPLGFDIQGFNVVIYIKMPKVAELLPRIEKLLKDKEFLLFLKAKRVLISLSVNDNEIASVSRTQNAEAVELAMDGNVVSRWLMHSELVDVTPEVREYIAQNVSSVPEKLRASNQIEVTSSIRIGRTGEFEPLQDSVVYTYLPTSYGNLGVPYLINANFITDAGRQHLQRDSEWNKLIFREAPRMFLKWLATLSHEHPEYYRVLPQRHARIADALSNVFFSSLSDAIREIAFLPSSRVQDKKILAADAYVDRIGFSEVFGAKRFLDAASSLFGRTYNEECEIADADSSILSSYGVKTFDSSDVLRLLTDGRVLADITIEDDFRLISFLCKTITSSEEVEGLRPVPFLLDDANNLNVVCDLSIPSHFKETNASAKEVRTLNECLYAKLKGTDELRWLQSNFGIKEMSNLGFVEYILHHPDYVNLDNAISVGRFLFHAWKKDNFLARNEFAKEIKGVKFLTTQERLYSIVNLYLGSSYHPLHDIEKVASDMDVFVSSKYPEDCDSLDEWSFFFKSCGARDQVGISQRILNAEPITDKSKASEDLRPYPLLEEAAASFYLRKHEKSNYYFLNPIINKRVWVSYFTFIDPATPGNVGVEKYVLNIALSQVFRPEAIEDKISGEVKYWWKRTGSPKYKIVDSLRKFVANKYQTFLEYAIAEKQLFPTTMGKRLPAMEVFINSTEIVRLAGSYLPVLDITNPVHHSWRKILPFKEKLSLDALASHSLTAFAMG